MKKTFFGTDGIRAESNSSVLNGRTMMKLGMALGKYFTDGNHRHKAVIGKDTRLSGYMIEQAVTSGLLSMGMDVFLFGPIPTPGVAMLTKSMRADLGIMITASHNKFTDNGLKIFDKNGNKLSDEIELEIERLMTMRLEEELIEPEKSRTISVQDRTKVLPVGKMIQPAVVKLSRNSGSHTGTGAFITSDGYIITNAHVVGDATVVDVKLFDGREYVAEVIGNTYPENQPDLALLKIEAKNLPWIELADEVNIGDTIVGVGNPLDFVPQSPKSNKILTD